MNARVLDVDGPIEILKLIMTTNPNSKPKLIKPLTLDRFTLSEITH